MKKITLTIASLLIATIGFAQNDTVATATLIEALPFTDAGADPTGATQEEGSVGCNFNVPSLMYKFTVVTGGTIDMTIATPTGLSEPVAYYATTIDETDPTLLTVTDNLGGVGAGCFDNDAGVDGMRSTVVNAGDIMFVYMANEGPSDITFSSADGAEVLMILGVEDEALAAVSVYPNPATDVLNINVPSTIELKGATLYDVLGKATNLTLNNGQINVSGLARGVYILDVLTSAGTLTEKVVIE